jgi:hypothetical protein
MAFRGFHTRKVMQMYVTQHKNTERHVNTNGSLPDWLQQKLYEYGMQQPTELLIKHKYIQVPPKS